MLGEFVSFSGEPEKRRGRQTDKSEPKGVYDLVVQTLKNIKNLAKQSVPTRKIDKRNKIIKWETLGGDNDFPQQLIQKVDNSPAASSALDLWVEFTEGDGLLNEKEGEIILNEKLKLTLDDFHTEFARDIATFWGISFRQKYNNDGTKADIEHLPFEEVRIGEPDKTGQIDFIYHNPFFGTLDFKDDFTRWYYAYNPDPAFVKEQIKTHNANEKHQDSEGNVIIPYPGQAYWIMIPSPLARVYPKPFYYSTVSWFQIDHEIQKFHAKQIKNDFRASGIIQLYGDPSAPAGPTEKKEADETGKLDQKDTVGGRFDAQLQKMSKSKGGLITLWSKKQEEQAQIIAYPANNNDGANLELQKQTTNQISIGFKSPRILMEIGEPGKLGDTQEIVNAIRKMQGRTKRLRNKLTRIYKEVFDEVQDGTIKNVNPVNVIPDQIWDSLTTNEKRLFIGEHFDLTLDESPNLEGVEEIQETERIVTNVKKLLNGS